ncbi:MAG: hypothetical protein HYX68_17160 [Planctomycetes bacterium]|nr:hypothetical protein [Planctomycetota bacterium]
MKKRLALVFAVATVFCSMGAEFRTRNFVVIAPNAQIGQSVGQWAEHYRKEKAILWLGREMPPWPQPCPLRVHVTMDPPSGETEFTFGMGGVNSQRMIIRGPIDRLIYSVLPHEITHTVFAHHFKTPVPRWADEGGSVLSEDSTERDRHDKLVRNILNRNQQIPMRTLLGLKEYPPQVMCLYAQGYSIADYLVKRSNRQHFLSFVGYGLQYGWDHAARTHYGHNRVEELEQAWLKNLRETRNQGQQQQFAANQTPGGGTRFMGTATGKTTRMTIPPAQPFESQAIARGAMPTAHQAGHTRWQPGVRLEAPVPIESVIPTIPSARTGVELGMPVR